MRPRAATQRLRGPCSRNESPCIMRHAMLLAAALLCAAAANGGARACLLKKVCKDSKACKDLVDKNNGCPANWKEAAWYVGQSRQT